VPRRKSGCSGGGNPQSRPRMPARPGDAGRQRGNHDHDLGRGVDQHPGGGWKLAQVRGASPVAMSSRAEPGRLAAPGAFAAPISRKAYVGSATSTARPRFGQAGRRARRSSDPLGDPRADGRARCRRPSQGQRVTAAMPALVSEIEVPDTGSTRRDSPRSLGRRTPPLARGAALFAPADGDRREQIMLGESWRFCPQLWRPTPRALQRPAF
jgi:hypothetical protein